MLKRQSILTRKLFNRVSGSVNKVLALSRMPCYLAAGYPVNKRLFHAQAIESHHASPLVNRINSLEIYRNCSGNLGFWVTNRKSSGFMVNGCFDSSYKKVDQKARVTAQHRQLLGDHENPPTQREEHAGAKLTNGRPSIIRPGSPLGFPDNEKLAVAVDVDEVLGNFVSALNRFIADRYAINHSVSEYHVYEFFKIWNCSRDEADLRVHEFFKTPYFKKEIHPLPGAQQALHNLSRFCNLSVVTSRQNAIKDHTIEWIEEHYPGLFKEIHFGNHFALHGESRPKSEICRSIGANVLIDDNPRYAIECAEDGMKVLLFDYENSYPWCKSDSVDEHPLVTRVRNWEEVEQQLDSWVVSKC